MEVGHGHAGRRDLRRLFCLAPERGSLRAEEIESGVIFCYNVDIYSCDSCFCVFEN